MTIYCIDIGDILKRIFGYVWCVYGVIRAVYAEDEDPLAKLSEIINRLRTHYILYLRTSNSLQCFASSEYKSALPDSTITLPASMTLHIGPLNN